ncbi:MAG: sugar phosphate isomerase/epimerase [Phycisphaeraceae bacterium]|nr:sugar phosphate isomerase/epimerase [Phycisphaeraceae bacterium]
MTKLATVAAFGFPDFNPPTLLPLYRRMGCRTSQFYRNTRNPPAVADARRMAEDAGLPIDSIHGVFGPEYDPSCPDERIRRDAVETYIREGELTRQLGGSMVVVHPAPSAAQLSDITPAVRAARIAPFQKTLADLAREGDRLGVIYLFENIPPKFLFGNDPVQLAQLIRQMNHPCIRMCYDTGHAHMSCLDGPSNAVAVLDEVRDVVSYLHVHDNDGRADSHQVPGLGTLDWNALSLVLSKMPPATVSMLELFEPESSLKNHLNAGLPQKLRGWMALG